MCHWKSCANDIRHINSLNSICYQFDRFCCKVFIKFHLEQKIYFIHFFVLSVRHTTFSFACGKTKDWEWPLFYRLNCLMLLKNYVKKIGLEANYPFLKSFRSIDFLSDMILHFVIDPFPKNVSRVTAFPKKHYFPPLQNLCILREIQSIQITSIFLNTANVRSS